ncbi:MAG: hypothetical protein IKX74_05245 [Erysipelotrichaceae bacterium]|nr:hypothetical protein [Erysipelotrichaceae bacterium]MBR5049025.1 hypothetical protein [Erysipelotrichaceae bacterium]
MARYVYDRYNRRYRKQSNFPWALIFFFLMTSGFLEVAFDFAGSLIDLIMIAAGILIVFGIPIAMFVGFIVLIGKLIGAIGQKKKVSRSATSVSTKELLSIFQSYFEYNDKLYIDKDTYIVKTSAAGESLEDYDLFMNDEYVSDLKLFANSFPSGFNSFANVVKDLTSSKKNKKKKKQEVEQPTVKEEKKEEPQVTTDCAFYISRLTSLSSSISNQQIREGLAESIKYLNQIKKIEDEFSECKNKTTKLYQYYLPMLTDILQNYVRLSSNTFESEDLKASEDRLLKTIVLINGALKTISSSLTEDYYTDLKVDMKTLESVLKKDGLVDELNQTGLKEGE